MKHMLLLPAAAFAVFLSSCGTDSHYVDATDTTVAVKNKTRMSSSDWVLITQEAGNALLSSPLFEEYLAAYKLDAEAAFKKAEESGVKMTAREKISAMKPLLMLSTIQNNTSEHIDSKLLTERLREILFNSGKVRFTTYAAGTDQSIDAATGQARDLSRDPNINKETALKKGTVHAYDLSLAGVIIKQTAQDGRNNEMSYTFSLTLTDNSTGEGVWTYTKEIKRQYTQGGFSW